VSLKLTKLNLPEVPVKLKREEGIDKIFDPVRKLWLQLTPEEWVRQSFLLYMHHVNDYPLSLAETEKQIQLYNTIKRVDIVFNDRNYKPRVIVECKAPHIKLNKAVFEQVSRYYFSLAAETLIVTNGMEHFAFRMAENEIQFLTEIPKFEQDNPL